MDYGDYLKIFLNEKMSERSISAAKSLYPELAELDLNVWTNSDFELYIKKQNDEIFKPSKNQAVELLKRGITFEDARYLLKEFHSYDSILAQSDEILKEYLEDYYKFKENYVKELRTIERINKELLSNNDFAIMSSPPTNLQGTTYRYVSSVPYYGSDWFHIDSETHISDYKYWYGEGAKNIWTLIYGSGSPVITNMWGSWSVSQQGAHEGIDFAGTHQIQLKSPLAGNVILRNATNGTLVVYNGSYSFFFMHMSNLNQNQSVNIGDILGRQSNLGNAVGSHLHFAVESGYKTTTSYGNDHILGSSSPYMFW